MAQLTRRAFIGCGAIAGAGAVGAYVLGTTVRRPRATAHPAPATSGANTFLSEARGGVSTRWAIARPPGRGGPLRPVIALHGRGSNLDETMSADFPDRLDEIVKAGLPPFAVVGVDGGDNFWHKRANGDDPGAMVLNELIPMLAGQGLDTSRVGFLGWSMGGYGALLLGARLGRARTAAICAVSPALWTSPETVPEGAFDGPEDYAANSVWGQRSLASIPIRIDCGESDGFAAATRAFIAQLPNGAAGGLSPGGHGPAFWNPLMQDELAWLAPLMAR
ncbi:alpha/beta hydrolase [Mycobacterium sp. SMC-18]|uniref:alpha/beta hydrolase n=1 Tax=unclassified Mycobacterium TaxID=2642494 RepID=UPI0038762572